MFVDARDAYYAVIKHFLFTDGVLDSPAQLEATICRIHTDEAQRRQLAALLVGPGLLDSADLPVLNYIRGVLCGSWTTTHVDASQLFEPATGTTPGAPLADVLFQLVFTLALDSLQSRLADDGLLVEWGPEASAQLSTWADDLSIPLEAPQATCLVAHASKAAVHAHTALHSIGLQVNFSPGKTEAMLVWRGAKSQELRRHYLSVAHPSIPLLLCNGQTAELTLARSYLHLGGLVRDDDCQFEDIDRRRQLAQAMYVRLRKALFFNCNLSASEKLALLFSLVHKKFLHGAGFWRLDTQRELQMYSKTIGQWYRSSLRPLTGLSCRGLQDDEIQCLLGVLGPSEIIAIERCRLLLVLANKGDAGLWDVLEANARWAQVAAQAARQVCPASPPSFGELVRWISQDPQSFRRALSAFRKGCLRSQQGRFGSTQQRAIWLRDLHQRGGLSFHVRIGCGDAEFACGQCGMRCRTKAALAAHRSKAHGDTAIASQISGSVCQRCSMEYWTTPRLRLHLRKREECLAVHLGSDVEYASWEFCNEIRARRKPACRILLAQPFWATLQPACTEAGQAVVLPSVQLRRCLRRDDVGLVFRDLVLRGSSQRIDREGFAQLSQDVQARLVNGVPNASVEITCRVIDLACQIVDAVIAGRTAACAVEGFAASVQDGRCTFMCQ